MEGEKDVVNVLTCIKPRANGRSIVGCYILRPFVHPVACSWELFCAKFETGQTFSSVQMDPITPKFGNCWPTILRPFARGVISN